MAVRKKTGKTIPKVPGFPDYGKDPAIDRLKARKDEIRELLNERKNVQKVSELMKQSVDNIGIVGSFLSDNDEDVYMNAILALRDRATKGSTQTRKAIVSAIREFLNSHWFRREADDNTPVYTEAIGQLDGIMKMIRKAEGVYDTQAKISRARGKLH